MPERHVPSPEELLAYLDGDLPAGRRATVEGALAASTVGRRRLHRLEETPRLLRAGTPLDDDAAARMRLRGLLAAERAALHRTGAPRPLFRRWRRPGLAVALTAAALPLILLVAVLTTRPFADAGENGGDGRAPVARHAREPTANRTAERQSVAAAPRGPAIARRRVAPRPRLAFACETPRRVAAASIARSNATRRHPVGAPSCFPDATTARFPSWPHATIRPGPGGPPAVARPVLVRSR